MKRLIPVIAIVFAWAMAAGAAPAPITTLRAVSALGNAEASRALPVSFEATVTYFRSYEKTMFVQDGDAAIYVEAATSTRLVPGDRVLITGTTHESFRPYVVASDIALLRHGPLPPAAPAVFGELIKAKYDCALVTVRAQIRAADLVLSSERSSTSLQMYTEDGNIDAVVDSDDPGPLNGLLDAEVEVTGVASGLFDGKMQQVGVLLHVASLANIKVIKRVATNPWSLPLTPMDRILAGYRAHDRTPRVRVRGTITYYQPGSAVVLQDGAKSLWITTKSRTSLRIDDVADATGFPDSHSGFMALTMGEIRDSHVPAPIAPQPANWRQLSMSQNIFDLVSIEGKVVTEVREASRDEYVLSSGGQLLTAVYRHPSATSLLPTPPMKDIPVGSRVRVSGVCILESSDPFDYEKTFNILLRSFDDITVVGSPTWLNIDNLMILAGVLLAVVLAVGARGWTLERKVRRQTAALAYIERRRGHILEDINGSRPLAEVVEQITELVSFKLHGAPCWCQIADGARLGNCPADLPPFRVVREPIHSHSGLPLGTVYAALDPLNKPRADESEALTMAAGLVTLAIETRRLYSDLLHRSDFDLLTDIYNRFSLEKHLDALIEQADMNGGMFGLIYIDLDDFKQVNDLHGHHTGDLYLQEVALRMKRQLRGGDMLARLGGDEFAALAPVVRSRADVEEVALRLERCFDEPFTVNGILLRGSASVGIAIFPEDGANKDSLLSTADAAMYVAKHTRRQIAELAETIPQSKAGSA